MARWLIEKAGVQITIKAKGKEANALVAQVLADIPHQEVKASRGVRIGLSRDDDGLWILKDKASDITRKLGQTGDVVYHLSDRIVFHIADKSQGVHCLHAACVAYKGQALVIPADSGAGKSTLTTWLVAQGFDYLSDELILVYPDGHIEGIARPIQIKFHGITPIEALIAEQDLVETGKQVTAVPVAALSNASSLDRADGIALFLFPKFEKGSGFSFEQLTSAKAGLNLMGNHVNARSLEGHGFSAMMELMRNTPSYALHYGGFGDLPADFKQQIEALLAPKRHRHIRSFVKREGKLTKGQENAINEMWPSLGIELEHGPIDFDKLFDRTAPTILEIGFGNGLSLAEMAENHPQTNFFGVEVHTPGVGSCLVQVKKRGLTNVRLSMDDAVEVVKQQIADASLERIQIFFPDPWHKKRHHKRRLIQPEFVKALLLKLKPGGHLHVATDWQNYAEHILEVLSAEPALDNTAKDYADKPDYRPQTKYETRGERLGHGVWDIIFSRR